MSDLVERLMHPDLRDRPFALCGEAAKRITELEAELSTVRGENEALKKAVKEEAEGHTHACHDMHEANAELAAAKVRIGELNENLLTAKVRIGELGAKVACGLSWAGFNLLGDKKSIDEAKRLLHEAGRAEQLVVLIKDERARVERAESELSTANVRIREMEAWPYGAGYDRGKKFSLIRAERAESALSAIRAKLEDCSDGCAAMEKLVPLERELAAAKVRIGELEAKLEEWKRLYHVADKRADDFEDKHAIVSAELVTADAELELRRRTDIADAEGRRFQRDREQELLSALSTSIEQGKVLGIEVQVLREALEGLLRSIKPFASAVYNDNGDCTVTPHHDYDSYISAYFSERKARAALAQVSEDIPH